MLLAEPKSLPDLGAATLDEIFAVWARVDHELGDRVKAGAVVGRPLTPGSVAGVHRRHHRHHRYYNHVSGPAKTLPCRERCKLSWQRRWPLTAPEILNGSIHLSVTFVATTPDLRSSVWRPISAASVSAANSPWQVVGTYGFRHIVPGHAIPCRGSVDFSANGKSGMNPEPLVLCRR